jgi:DNA-binding response OmpR family regulator
MLQVDEVTSDWSVLLVLSDLETARMLAVILDGFGYTPLECRDHGSAFEQLSKTTPFAAVVDLQVEDAERICNLVKERGGVSLVVLLGKDESDPEKRAKKLGAKAWGLVESEPEKILTTLRTLVRESRPE